MMDAESRTTDRCVRWVSRGYLPHADSYVRGEGGEAIAPESITFRLADSLPRSLVHAVAAANAAAARRRDRAPLPAALRAELERIADSGYGSCSLQDPIVASIVEDAMLFHDGERFRLIAWCVMPNHLHVLIERLAPWRLDQVVHSWKSFTARRANQHLGRTGTFWMRDYFDRYIRDVDHFNRVVRYIEMNPVKAGLCERPAAWRWSSARRREAGMD